MRSKQIPAVADNIQFRHGSQYRSGVVLSVSGDRIRVQYQRAPGVIKVAVVSLAAVVA